MSGQDPGRPFVEYYSNSIVIVTGAASGIGRALCYELARRGATIIAADIDRTGVQTTAQTIIESGGSATAAVLDVTDRTSVTDLIEKTAARFKRLDLVFNNAGIGIAGELCDMTPQHWRRIVDVNLMGVIYGTDAAYRVMKKQGFGHIVNTASMAGLVPTPFTCAYSTTKHAIVGLSTALRYEAAPHNVRVSVVCPGFIKTEIFDNMETLPTLKFDPSEYFPLMMDVRKAAHKILAGVGRNRAVIAFPASARFAALVYRIAPGLFTPLYRVMMKRFLKSVR
jgi:NAD(P)-dependent dehydrogenase (short-subunit alcohol dehydrogenase family)